MRDDLADLWKSLNEGQRDFWEDAYVRQVRHVTDLTAGSRRGGRQLRYAALVASAAVTALAGFTADWIRYAIATLGFLAVILTGAASVLRVEPRLIVNRKYQELLLQAGWDLVTGHTGVETSGHPDAIPSEPTVADFERFATRVKDLRSQYTSEYAERVDSGLDHK